MIDKINMTEEEIKLNYITPSITDKWSMSCIRMEFLVAPGRIMLDGKKAKRKDASRADYLLFYKDTSTCRPNSTLVTYGYSFGDEHINRVIIDMTLTFRCCPPSMAAS